MIRQRRRSWLRPLRPLRLRSPLFSFFARIRFRFLCLLRSIPYSTRLCRSFPTRVSPRWRKRPLRPCDEPHTGARAGLGTPRRRDDCTDTLSRLGVAHLWCTEESDKPETRARPHKPQPQCGWKRYRRAGPRWRSIFSTLESISFFCPYTACNVRYVLNDHHNRKEIKFKEEGRI